jgi:transposase
MPERRTLFRYTNEQLEKAVKLEREGKSHNEIAKETGIRAGSVYRVLQKSRQSPPSEMLSQISKMQAVARG